MLNRVDIIGNLGADPEVRQVGDSKVANLRISVNEKWKDKNTGERREKTEWVPVTLWGPLAGIAEQYLKKGSKVYVSGKFTTRKYQAQDGTDRYATDVVVQGFGGQLVMLDSAGGRGDDSGYSPPPQSSGPTVGSGTPDDEDSIPF